MVQHIAQHRGGLLLPVHGAVGVVVGVLVALVVMGMGVGMGVLHPVMGVGVGMLMGMFHTNRSNLSIDIILTGYTIPQIPAFCKVEKRNPRKKIFRNFVQSDGIVLALEKKYDRSRLELFPCFSVLYKRMSVSGFLSPFCS